MKNDPIVEAVRQTWQRIPVIMIWKDSWIATSSAESADRARSVYLEPVRTQTILKVSIEASLPAFGLPHRADDHWRSLSSRIARDAEQDHRLGRRTGHCVKMEPGADCDASCSRITRA